MPSAHSSQSIVGRVIARVEYDYDDALRLHFTDGSMLYVSAVWHNDGSAGTEVALIDHNEPKSYAEAEDFYDHVSSRRWDRD